MTELATSSRPGDVLVITQAPSQGGVNAMTNFAVSVLRQRGFAPVLAYYKPYTKDRGLSVPSWQLAVRAPRLRRVELADGIPAIEIGVRLPELENCRYRPSALWRQTIAQFPHVVVVSGSALAATAVAAMKVPSLIWLATPYDADRIDRIKTLLWYRRLLERAIDAPLCRAIEKRILDSASVVAVSAYTARKFADLASGRNFPVMPVPVDTEFFCPGTEQPVPGRIGFVGRFGDPRKNLPLLLEAVALCRRQRHDVTLSLVGDGSEDQARSMLSDHGLQSCAVIHAGVPRADLPALYRQFDVLVLPSHQEGLGIVGLEAMACGTPVVATRCGGPEEYVVPGETGYLTAFDAGEMAQLTLRLIADRALRARMAGNAVAAVEGRYSIPAATAAFWRLFDTVDWPRRGHTNGYLDRSPAS